MTISVRESGMPMTRVQELALHEHPRALDLEPQPDEERRDRVEVCNGDTDMIEAPYL
jgi:hypothetical protein